MAETGYDRYIQTIRDGAGMLQEGTNQLRSVNKDLKRFLQKVEAEKARSRSNWSLRERGDAPLPHKPKTR